MTTRYVSALARARGLGAAGHGPGHWWAQRVSAAALVPLVFWLVVTLASGVAAEHAALTAWLSAPLDATLMILLLIAAFHHAALGFRSWPRTTFIPTRGSLWWRPCTSPAPPGLRSASPRYC